MKIVLEPPTQMVPENNAANANFTRTNNTQSLASANRDAMEAMDFPVAFLFGLEKSHVLREKLDCPYTR